MKSAKGEIWMKSMKGYMCGYAVHGAGNNEWSEEWSRVCGMGTGYLAGNPVMANGDLLMSPLA